MIEFLTEVGVPSSEILEEWGDQPLGRFCVLAQESEFLTSEITGIECPLCLSPLSRLNINGNRFGRTVAKLSDESVLVDVLPEHLSVLGCGVCDVCFYEGDRAE